jgi:hypothetical protein
MMSSRAIPSIATGLLAALLGLSASAASEVYIQQAHGLVARDATAIAKPPPNPATPGQPAAAGPTAPETCNSQNATTSQACYAATQQARPASR